MANESKFFSPGTLAVSPLAFRIRRSLKRLVDILVAALALLLIAPFFAFLALAIKRNSPGPIFFRGRRSGRDGREFDILKFRTMREEPQSYNGPRVTAKDDQRVTSLGKWLRDTKLNELPQFWNVLIGEMSLVGPRPEDPHIVQTWPADARREILSVRPGITSPASILYRQEESLLSGDGVMDIYFREIVPDKLRLDSLYVRNHSFAGDLDIIFWTARALIPLAARQKIPESDIFVGPLYRFTRRHLSWFMLDFLVCLAAFAVIGLTWRVFEPIDWGLAPLILLALAAALLFSGVNVLLKLHRVFWSRAEAEDGLLLLMSNGLSFTIIVWFNTLLDRNPVLLPVPALPFEMIVLIGALILLGSLSMRYRSRLVTSFANRWFYWRAAKASIGERVLILGAGEGGEIVQWLLHHSTFREIFTVVGIVDDDPAKRGMRVNRSWVLGSINELPDLIRKHDIGVIVFAITNISPEARAATIKLCQQPGVRLIYLSDLLGAIQSQLVNSPSSPQD